MGSPKSGHLGNKKGMKRRPSPLDLRGGGEVRVDPELQEHLDDIASAVTVVTNGEQLLQLRSIRPGVDNCCT
jgi:hypothetical protein